MSKEFVIGDFDAEVVAKKQERQEQLLIEKIDEYVAHAEHGRDERRLAKDAATAAIQLLHWYERGLLGSTAIRQRIEQGAARIMRRVTIAGTRQDVTPLDYFTTKKTQHIGRQFDDHHKIHFEHLTAFGCWLSSEEIKTALTTRPARNGSKRETVPAGRRPQTLGDCEDMLICYVKERYGFAAREDAACYEAALRAYVRSSLENMSGEPKNLPWDEPRTPVSW